GVMRSRDFHEPALVSVVIPFFNEEAGVDALFERLMRVLDENEILAEIICVDDGSSDGTWDKLSLWHSQYRNITLVSLSRNFGKEIAITAGLDVAEGNAVVIMDADLQHPPELIPVFI